MRKKINLLLNSLAAMLIMTVFLSPLLAVPAYGLDEKAKDEFSKSVNKVGGSEASSATGLIKNSINILLYVTGVVAVIVIVVGSFRFITAEGDSQGANKARNSVVFALIGLVLASVAYAIVNFVLRQF